MTIEYDDDDYIGFLFSQVVQKQTLGEVGT